MFRSRITEGLNRITRYVFLSIPLVFKYILLKKSLLA